MADKFLQIDVKRALVEHRFPPSERWKVSVGLDGMERGHGKQQSLEKRQRAGIAEQWLREWGVTVGTHPKFGRADLVAE